MKVPSAHFPKLVGGVAALSLAAAFAGCSLVADEVNSAIEDPDVGEVVDRFAAMTEIPGDAAGSTVVEASEPGTIWALTRRDDVPKVSPDDCSVDGAVMEKAAESLNLPEPHSLEAEGGSQTLFAFASTSVGEAGSHTVTCDLDDTPALLFLFEPSK